MWCECRASGFRLSVMGFRMQAWKDLTLRLKACGRTASGVEGFGLRVLSLFSHATFSRAYFGLRVTFQNKGHQDRCVCGFDAFAASGTLA